MSSKRSHDEHSSETGGPRSSLLPSSPPPFSDIPEFGNEEDLDQELVPDLDELAEEANGIDLFGENMERDYTQRLDFDHYDADDVDDEDYDAMDITARRQVEARLARRDRDLARQRQAGAVFIHDDDEPADLTMTRRRRRHYDEISDTGMDDVLDEELSLESLADVKADTIGAWIAKSAVHRTIAREFKSFLLEYTDEVGKSVYGERIRTLGEINSESLEISYAHLAESKAILAYFLANAPSDMFRIFDIVAMEATLLHYPDYERIHSDIHVRVADLPTSFTLRELRQTHLNCLVRVSGVVTRRTGVFPQLKYVKFDCTKCRTTLGPFPQDSNTEIKISYCQNCQSRGPFTLNSEKTIYRNYQKMTLQESPGTVPAGRLPRHREVVMLWDLIDSAKPGEEIEVTGVYRNNFDASLNTKNGFPVFATIIEANHVAKAQDVGASWRLTEDDERTIRQLSRDDHIIDKVIASIAPSIYGHNDIKTAVALSLFSGVPKDINGKHKIRGDINVLLLGDPGTAKSQILKYIEKTAHRAVYTTGQGASAVGLTASVRKDVMTSEWTLEGGALVLADQGVCMIDEFDKMNDQDRTSIHEAMEQQSISISKAGIVTTLQARCAIIAAANPIGGRYNSSIPFSQNVELTEPILSRFDILCVVKDTVDAASDERLADFVVNSHARSHPQFGPADGLSEEVGRPAVSPLQQDILRKYILYARDKVRPKLHNMDQDKLARLYSDMRRESLATGSYPITVRHLESVIRISEAFAKMCLREYVKTEDIDRAIKVSVESFVNAQKTAVKKSLSRAFVKYTR